MADAPVVHIGENSPEYVAYRLMLDIAEAEGKRFSKPVAGSSGGPRLDSGYVSPMLESRSRPSRAISTNLCRLGGCGDLARAADPPDCEAPPPKHFKQGRIQPRPAAWLCNRHGLENRRLDWIVRLRRQGFS
jgi:hypothetical protein